jgi:hypothetical protein
MMRASSGARKESASGFAPLHDVVWRLWMWERQEGRRESVAPPNFLPRRTTTDALLLLTRLLFFCHPERGCRVEGPPRSDARAARCRCNADKLDFEHHLKFYEPLMGPNPGPDDGAYFRHRAEEMHSFAVYAALSDARLAIQTVEPMLSSSRAKHFVRYGVGRRLGMIWRSYREIVLDLVPPDRQEPLPQDDVSTVENHLNVIYINIMGVLDNYAGCLQHEVAPDKGKLRPNRVGLFSSAFMIDPNLSGLRALLAEEQRWYEELKTRRDPAAHRFPLYVPPCALNREQEIQYRELEDDFMKARNSLNFEKCDELRRRQEKIGTFVSYFLHDFDQPPIPIYPTVPQDIANLVRVGEHVRTFLLNRSGAR